MTARHDRHKAEGIEHRVQHFLSRGPRVPGTHRRAKSVAHGHVGTPGTHRHRKAPGAGGKSRHRRTNANQMTSMRMPRSFRMPGA